MNFIERYREATTPPEGVRVATHRERWVRFAWMNLSTLLGVLAVVGPLALVLRTVEGAVPMQMLVLLVAVAIPLVFLLDIFVIFPWGVRRLDLTPPWQFRLHEAEEVAT